MNAVFSIGKVKVGTESGDLLEKEVEMVTLSGGFLGKDEITRPSTADDHLVYKAEHDAYLESLKAPGAVKVIAVEVISPPLLPASAGAETTAAVTGAVAAGAGDTPKPSAG